MNNDKRVEVIGKLLNKCDNLMRQRDDLEKHLMKDMPLQYQNQYDDILALDAFNNLLNEIKELKDEIDLLASDYEKNNKGSKFSKQNLFKTINDINNVYKKDEWSWLMDTNYVIYHRDNHMLGLSNHIDGDGDLDPNYALLRNTALTGKFINGKFISSNPKRFGWLIECAEKGCPICNGIFTDVKTKDYTIKPFYIKNVVKVDKLENAKRVKFKTETKWDKLLESKTKKTDVDKDAHPLMQEILNKFT